MLVAWLNLKRAENDEEDEKIIDAQRLLNQITREEFEAPLLAEPMPDSQPKDDRKCHPGQAPDGRFPQANFVRLAMKDAEVQRDRDQNEQIEFEPQPGCAHGLRRVSAPFFWVRFRSG